MRDGAFAMSTENEVRSSAGQHESRSQIGSELSFFAWLKGACVGGLEGTEEHCCCNRQTGENDGFSDANGAGMFCQSRLHCISSISSIHHFVVCGGIKVPDTTQYFNTFRPYPY